MNKVFLVALLIFSSLTQASDTWSGWRDIDDIYTYTSEDTLYVYLKDISCPNAKNYFAIVPSVAANAKQMISMVLAAKMSKTQINVLYDPEQSSSHCYFKGLKLRN
jgi:hypothetical protein